MYFTLDAPFSIECDDTDGPECPLSGWYADQTGQELRSEMLWLYEVRTEMILSNLLLS